MSGCAQPGGNQPVPTLPSTDQSASSALTEQYCDIYDGPYQLWGEWTLYFNPEHDSVAVTPRRLGRFHLNAVKFLESYCTDCLEITNLKNNGDETIDLTVRITHPFKGHPEYTGFDVKGIIMFNGSYEYPSVFSKEPPYPDPYKISWRILGDPELLNSDGWTMRWSPAWETDSDLPMFNYWPGKYSMGTPTANLNGFRNFYTHEQRHMFSTNGIVQRTYTIWLPPGEPVVAGYAVEACWAPPINTPVTDPLNDFALSANQPEPYVFDYVVNNNQPITEEPCCNDGFQDCSRFWVECARWDGVVTGIPPFVPDANTYIYLLYPSGNYKGIGPLFNCSPKKEDAYWVEGGLMTYTHDNGIYRELARYCEPPTLIPKNVVIDIYDFTIDIDD